MYVMVLFFRLFAHAEDPDIDEPYKPPVGHVLGKGNLYTTKSILVIKFTSSYSLIKLSNLVKVHDCIYISGRRYNVYELNKNKGRRIPENKTSQSAT